MQLPTTRLVFQKQIKHYQDCDWTSQSDLDAQL